MMTQLSPKSAPLTRALLVTALVLAAAIPRPSFGQTPANSLAFAGKPITIDTTSCSPENNADGKNRAIEAINAESASHATIEFATLNPTSGSYTTAADEDHIAPNTVYILLGGSAFNGAFMAKPGQTITITATGPTYRAQFNNLALLDIAQKSPTDATASADLSCH